MTVWNYSENQGGSHFLFSAFTYGQEINTSNIHKSNVLV